MGAFFLGSVHNENSADERWHIDLPICGKMLRFKIDTGADITVMSYSSYLSLPMRPAMCQTAADVRSLGGKLQFMGKFLAITARKGQKYSFWIFVVSGACTNNLLSRAVACKMGLVKIELREDAQPYSVTTPRRVPFPLLTKVEQELARMQSLGIIEEVREATDWCAPMVPVVKKNGKIRICVRSKATEWSGKEREVHLAYAGRCGADAVRGRCLLDP
ncbi:hypothetical protein SRHO_G00333370 [Serrasalmus rhombeus]